LKPRRPSAPSGEARRTDRRLLELLRAGLESGRPIPLGPDFLAERRARLGTGRGERIKR